MNVSHSRRARAGRIRHASALVLASAVVVAAAGCSSTTTDPKASGNVAEGDAITASSVDQAHLKETIKRALLADVPVSALPPVVADALAVASQPLTGDQIDLLKKCLSERACDTGHGTLTVAINADFTNNPWWSIRRAEATAQAIAYPQVKKIIFTSASSGDLAEVLANVRSLIAQGVDIIVEDPVFGAAIVPAAKLAQAAGVTFVTANSPLPASAASSVAAQIPYDLCSMGTAAAEKVVGDASGKAKTYAIYTGVPGNAVASDWQPCVDTAMEKAGWSKVQSGFTQWTAQGETQAANELLASGKDATAMFYDYTNDAFLRPYIDEGKTPPASFADTPNYSFFGVFDSAKKAGLDVVSYVSNGHVWYVRMAVTAGIEIKLGMDVPNKILAPVPVVSLADIQDQSIPGMPANAPVPTLLSPDLAKLALSAG